MVRNLAPDEVVWFIGKALAYLGHSDPKAMSLRLGPLLADSRGDGDACFVMTHSDRAPSAGVFLKPPDPTSDSLGLRFASPWHDGEPGDLRVLIEHLLARFEHDHAYVDLHSLGDSHRLELAELLKELGFVLDELHQLRFELSEVPPIGVPLVLDAWSQKQDIEFRNFYAAAEAKTVTDGGWSYLKRASGPFHPDLWFLARETLDQNCVGYAFFGTTEQRIDARFSLDAVGVRRDLREDSGMLRRLVISALQELSGISPMGVVDASIGSSDPKLTGILRSLGFRETARVPLLAKLPL